jgi:hypothetical protein
MTPGAVWWLIEAKAPEDIKTRGKEMSEVVKMLKAAKERENA